uniref:Autophagy-related protein 101 n=1 Tax=Eutreptiella gymnastica TaxID=73025 RepID=A0A7S1JF05_9EUGL|mmetsp:Transcript_90642/g.157090  ORF Transcript_90642/g.157090 Transcript_90642/m.157090 type:complete len:201 (+) Transcript_90642:31-633(+)
MNCPSVSLDPLKVGEQHIKDVLRCLIHTILFQRVLGPAVPTPMPLEVECDMLETTYCKLADLAVDSQVEECVDSFCRTLKRKDVRRSLIVAFYRTGKKASTGWFAKPDKVFWEYWMINLQVMHDADNREHPLAQVQFKEDLKKDLVDRMKTIIKQTDAAIENNHVPPLKEGQCFPFEIQFDTQYQSWPSSLMEWVKYGNG